MSSDILSVMDNLHLTEISHVTAWDISGKAGPIDLKLVHVTRDQSANHPDVNGG